MKKIIIGIISICLLSICTAFAYNTLPYYKSKGEIIVENVTEHNFKKWDRNVFNQMKEDYEKEISEISKPINDIEHNKKALKNAEKILNGFMEELYDQQATTEIEISEKKDLELYLKKELENLSNIQNELYPKDSYEEVLNEAIYFKEQVIWERDFYKDSSDELYKQVYDILGQTVLDAESLLKKVQSDKDITMDAFEKERAKILDDRARMEKNVGIKHLSEDDI